MQARRLLALAAACILSAVAGRAEEVKQEKATTPGPPAGQPWTIPDLGLELVWIEPESPQMGSNDGGPTEMPVHAVRISRGFWMGKYEVTQAEYEAIVVKNPSAFQGARNPVENVSWDDAVVFCTKLTEREQKAGRLPEGYEYRLPTEAEWEYAARGGAGSKGYTYAGSNSVDEVAWYSGNSATRTHPVGLKQPNELGLHDMSGNVWEWCLDWDEKYYSRLPNTFPANTPAGSFRVIRGGGRFIVANSWRVAYRPYYGPSYSRSNLGFRVAVAAPVRVF